MSVPFLFLLALKSVVALAAAFAIVAMLRGRPAADKATLLRCALIGLPFLPLLDVLLPTLRVVTPLLEPSALAGVVSPELGARGGPSLCLILLSVYAAGVALGLLRLTSDVRALRGWAARSEPLVSPAWTAALTESGQRNVRVLVSDRVAAPISFGWLSSTILIDRNSASRATAAHPILAHEFAHIARGDWVLTTASRLAAILFWFNPLAWMAKRAADHYAEEAVDQQVLRRVSARSYAQTLLDCASSESVPAALAMAGGTSLRRRIGLILEPTQTSKRGVWPAAIVAATTVLMAPLAAMQAVAPEAAAPTAPTAPTESAALTSPGLSARSGDATATVMSQTWTRAAPAPEAISVMPASFNDLDLPALPFPGLPSPAAPLPAAPLPGQETQTQSDSGSALSQPDAEDRRRERWMANKEQHQDRNERRAAQRERQQQARANRLWVQGQISNGHGPS